jgi:phosphate transport system protein
MTPITTTTSTTEHTVRAYDAELNDLSQHIAEMGGLAEQQLADAIAALVQADIELAQRVIAADARVDRLQRQIEETAIMMIARRQPMAQDLREIVASIHIANDLERIGDLAKNTAKRVIAIGGTFGSQRLVAGVEHMAELSIAQLKNVLDAFASRDLQAALAVWERDGEIDAMYTSLFRELLTYMMEDPRTITLCTHLLFCAKNVERIGDHATNIAETLHYLITGHALTDERPKKDNSSLTSVEYSATET